MIHNIMCCAHNTTQHNAHTQRQIDTQTHTGPDSLVAVIAACLRASSVFPAVVASIWRPVF